MFLLSSSVPSFIPSSVCSVGTRLYFFCFAKISMKFAGGSHCNEQIKFK